MDSKALIVYVLLFSLVIGTASAGFGEMGTGPCKCLNFTISVNSTNKSSTLAWTLVNTYSFPISFYIQPAILTTPNVENVTTAVHIMYNYSPNSTARRIIRIYNNQSVSVKYRISSYGFSYFNKTTDSEVVNITSLNFTNGQSQPSMQFNVTSGELKPNTNITILTQVVMPAPNNHLYDSLIAGNVLNASATLLMNPIEPIVQYSVLNATIPSDSNYSIGVTTLLPENISLHHLWQGYATAFATSTRSNVSGGAIQLGTAKIIEVQAVITRPKVTTTIATIASTTILQTAAAINISTTDILLIVVIIVIIVIGWLVLARTRTRAGTGKKKKGR